MSWLLLHQKWFKTQIETQVIENHTVICCKPWNIIIVIIIDRFYIALFSAREHTHCARMWFYMSE